MKDGTCVCGMPSAASSPDSVCLILLIICRDAHSLLDDDIRTAAQNLVQYDKDIFT